MAESSRQKVQESWRNALRSPRNALVVRHCWLIGSILNSCQLTFDRHESVCVCVCVVCACVSEREKEIERFCSFSFCFWPWWCHLWYLLGLFLCVSVLASGRFCCDCRLHCHFDVPTSTRQHCSDSRQQAGIHCQQASGKGNPTQSVTSLKSECSCLSGEG